MAFYWASMIAPAVMARLLLGGMGPRLEDFTRRSSTNNNNTNTPIDVNTTTMVFHVPSPSRLSLVDLLTGIKDDAGDVVLKPVFIWSSILNETWRTKRLSVKALAFRPAFSSRAN